VALGNARAHGSPEVVTVVITSNHPKVASPCGACRQVLLELAPQARILFGRDGAILRAWESPRVLLPDSFEGGWKP
jgi:cytidine deaminase